MEDNKTPKSEVALREEATLKFWAENHIFDKSLAKPADKGEFVFFEGPPTANAKPAFHHLEARAFKDILPRYKTMQGFHVRRKAGWDTHGLPVELQIEKKLGFTHKQDIEKYGVLQFNKLCKDSVFEYIGEWEKFTDRIGYWVDKDLAYYTFDASYMESVWNILKVVDDKKLLYKDYKVLPWCPRDETALSSHELAQGYQEDKDLSVTVKFKIKGVNNGYFLAWTTTPWTLPGNVALAVGPDIIYVEAKVANKNGSEILVLAKERLSLITEPYEIVAEHKGSECVGMEYEPLYPYLKDKFGSKDEQAFAKAYKVYAADFVNTTEGTGIVHTAVMYGQDDFELGTKIGLPKFHLVNEQGKFIDGMDNLSGRFVKEVDDKGKPTVATDIIDYLTDKNLFFSKENIKHQYPHCWRCKTPLIYYARDSWYIRMSSLREDLLKANEKINWEPSYIKEGRFGEWLREVKDWAISRERYWGTPMPVWTDKEGNYRVIGSVEELKKHIPKRNNYFLVRHGESENNLNGDIISSKKENDHPLTGKGKEEVEKTVALLRDRKIDVIISSPILRTKETAEIIVKGINFSGKVDVDEKLTEISGGEYEGKPWDEYLENFPNMSDRFSKHIGGAENWNDTRKRVMEFIYELDQKYENKNVVIISHGCPLNLLMLGSKGISVSEMGRHYTDGFFANAEMKEMDFRQLPHNENFEIDLHKPFIDSVQLVDEHGNALTRVKEVMDVWMDSGAMPFAQDHYPFENKEYVDTVGFPADFISEAIDQTRGWFYTLHAIGVLMGKGNAYKNVICLGHILDAEGKKMSKSIGNIVDPWMLMDKYGVDALRLWMYSVNQPGDSKNFDERTVDEIVKKVFNPLNNIFELYWIYNDDSLNAPTSESKNVLDRWIISRLNQLVAEGTKNLDSFKVFEASRAIRDFANDFSTWYIRRSRERFKSDKVQDRQDALGTTRYVLRELMKYMAPFTPFFAEEIYQKVKTVDDPESVHLCEWCKVGEIDEQLLRDMQRVRETVTVVLEARAKAGIKVRQPLASLVIKEDLSMELRNILAEEVNVKEVMSDASMPQPYELDITITPELQVEGNVRDFIRAVQELRKTKNLTPSDVITLTIETDGAGQKFVEMNSEMIKKPTNVGEFKFATNDGESFKVVDFTFKIVIQ